MTRSKKSYGEGIGSRRSILVTRRPDEVLLASVAGGADADNAVVEEYSVENVPLYDSEDDEPTSKFREAIVVSEDNTVAERENEDLMRSTDNLEIVKPIPVQPLNSVPMELNDGNSEKQEDISFRPQVAQKKFTQKSSRISRIRKKGSPHSNGKSKNHAQKDLNARLIGERLSSKEACDELLAYEEAKNLASIQLASLYDEIRPAIREHDEDSQDSVSTTIAEKWIEASCCKLKAEFDLYASIIKNVSCAASRPQDDVMAKGQDKGKEVLRKQKQSVVKLYK